MLCEAFTLLFPLASVDSNVNWYGWVACRIHSGTGHRLGVQHVDVSKSACHSRLRSLVAAYDAGGDHHAEGSA